MARTGPLVGGVAGALLAALAARPAAAHVGNLSQTVDAATIPLWLVAMTGGAVVGVSFLFASFMTDHDLIRAINRLRVRLPAAPSAGGVLRWLPGVVGVAVLAVIVASGLFGPQGRFTSFAVLVVWGGWWAGYTMTVYLAGNTWPALNPWKAIARGLSRASASLLDRPTGTRTYPGRLGVWPSTAALLGMVWVEVVSPVASRPRFLALVILAYTVVTVAGALVYGVDDWFGYVDPVARVFRWYGRVAPVQRTDDGLEFRLPNGSLSLDREDRFDETPFVVGLLWVTTYDGLVATPTWNAAVTPPVEAVAGALGVAPYAVALVVYSATILAGYWVFLKAYRLASAYAPKWADSYVRPETLERRFLPALLPIAAGYHLAHFLGYFLTLLPATLAVLGQPFSAPLDPQVLLLPNDFELLQLGLVVVGHVLAVWVAHAIAFETFPGRLKPIRSQYSYALVMVFYTTVSMGIVAQPFVAPAFL
jgi:hypothetical protein